MLAEGDKAPSFTLPDQNGENVQLSDLEGETVVLYQTVRSLDAGGVTCGVAVELTIGKRSAPVVSAWHYAEPDSAPRLVTAYPTPYNRAYGGNA